MRHISGNFEVGERQPPNFCLEAGNMSIRSVDHAGHETVASWIYEGHVALNVCIPLIIGGQVGPQLSAADIPVGLEPDFHVFYEFWIERCELHCCIGAQVKAAGAITAAMNDVYQLIRPELPIEANRVGESAEVRIENRAGSTRHTCERPRAGVGEQITADLL